MAGIQDIINAVKERQNFTNSINQNHSDFQSRVNALKGMISSTKNNINKEINHSELKKEFTEGAFTVSTNYYYQPDNGQGGPKGVLSAYSDEADLGYILQSGNIPQSVLKEFGEMMKNIAIEYLEAGVYMHYPVKWQKNEFYKRTNQLVDASNFGVDLVDNGVAVYSKMPYAPHIEYGFHDKGGNFIGPWPFLRPALQTVAAMSAGELEKFLGGGFVGDPWMFSMLVSPGLNSRTWSENKGISHGTFGLKNNLPKSYNGSKFQDSYMSNMHGRTYNLSGVEDRRTD